MSSIQAESLELARELSNYLQNVDIDENLQQRVEEKLMLPFVLMAQMLLKMQ